MRSDKPNRTPHPFDVSQVEKLIDLMVDHDLSEIDLREGGSRIRLRKGAHVALATAPAMPTAHATAPPTPAAPAHGAPAATDKKHHVITSPTPGTFYSRPSPDDPVYVKVGSKVTPESVVCKIEAMKIFNDIAAECSGTIVEILVDNAQPVEYGQPLFRVDLG